MGSQFIVGYTDTEGGRDALALALTLADSAPAGEAHLTVASITPWADGGFMAPGVSLEYERALAEDGEGRLSGAHTRCAGRDDVSFVVRGATSPAHGLQLLAEEQDADAIVVGRSHTGPLGRTFVGSTTEQTLHGAACPVGVAPRGYAEGNHRLATVAVAFDGSDESEHALEHAIRLARDRGAALRLVRVIEPMPTGYGEFIDPYPFTLRRTDVETALTAAAERIVGLDVTTAVLNGDASHALADQEDPADLLVMGSRDFGPIGRILLGGTSARLSRHCPSPLLVVPRVAASASENTDASAPAVVAS